MKEFTSISVGLDLSMLPEVWYAAVMPPIWGTSTVFVFGMLIEATEGHYTNPRVLLFYGVLPFGLLQKYEYVKRGVGS